MVYIFFVQPGDMMTFDNEISIMQSVGDLKEKIKERCNIPLEQQVLLISGGEPLDSQKNLCSYMAGTDTNPIFLFSTNFDVTKLDILRNLNYNDSDLKQRLADCLNLPVSLTTVRTRALVAQDYLNVAKNQLEFCESMIHEQHLQQQGWSAVIANLEDISCEFKKRWELFLKMYEDFIADRDVYNNFLRSFEEDKKILQRIPVIETLLEAQKDLMEISKTSEATTSVSETEPSREISLFDWISSSDTKDSLDELYELCKSNLNKFEKEIMPSLEEQIKVTLQSAEKPERREIEGLGKRLYDLEELLRRMKRFVEHQSDMAQSFMQNQNSVAHMKDTSILPDLCATHVQQMELIKQCHQKLMEDRNRIVKAKYELSKSLCARIGWVQTVENKLWELDSYLVYFHEHLQRLRKHLEVFQQLHLAPVTYMNAVVEVVRRRAFSQIFLLWASDLACQQLTIHNEEVTRRKDFSSQFEGHFLNALFPGMEDVPPAFATEAPVMFDAKLPKITDDDVEKLKKQVPDFVENLALPDMSHVVNFFTGKSSVKVKEDDKSDDAKAVEEKLIQAVSDVGLASNLDKNLLKATSSESCLVSAPGLPNLKDDKGCESETDTEEFEKVGQSPLELTFPQGVAVGAVPKAAEKQDASTSTEDNLQISRAEHEKLKTVFLNLSSIARLATTNLRTDLNEFKAQFVNESHILSKQYEDLGNSWETLRLEVDRNEKEIVDVMRRENELEKERFRYSLMEKEDVIKRLEEDKRAMEDRIQDTCRKIATLEEILAKQNSESTKRIEDLLRQLHDKDLDKEKCLKELSETLKIEHKTELDNIKSRFKLMTMERSPSLSSLEKEKSGDFASLPSHTPLLLQMTENFELDKEKAVSEERKRWEKLLDEKTRELQQRFEDEKELLNQDKDKQIDVLREREKNLSLEIVKYKTTIQQLAEYQEGNDSDLQEQVAILKRENEELHVELTKVREQASVAIEEKSGTTRGPSEMSPTTSCMSKSDIVSSRVHRLNIDSCKTGDIVLILWDQTHESFKVLQESKYLYFLHSDSLTNLDLSISGGKPNKIHCTGEVVEKDYCETRKGDNRFRLSVGTKFFLVKVKPVAPLSRSAKERDLAQSQFLERVAQPVVELLPKSVEKQLAEDSGIVDYVEQATAAIEDSDRLEEEKEPHSNGSLDDMKAPESFEALRKENEQLQEELSKLRSERDALMTTSVALCEGKIDATTSPLATSQLSKSDIVSSSRPPRLNIDSCKVGDIVLLLWDQAHENFKVLQESRHTYFLHSDCLEKLGLTITDGKPNRTYCTGEVIDKEYCQTRKSENRYKVPKGAKFFRVKVKSIAPTHRDSRDLPQSTSRHVPSMSTSQSVIAAFEPLIEEIPSSTVSERPRETPAKVSSEGSQDQSESLPHTLTESPEHSVKADDHEVQPKDAPRHFAEDSGIHEAMTEIEPSDRCEGDSYKEVIEQSTYISTNWLAMFRSMFNK